MAVFISSLRSLISRFAFCISLPIPLPRLNKVPWELYWISGINSYISIALQFPALSTLQRITMARSANHATESTKWRSIRLISWSIRQSPQVSSVYRSLSWLARTLKFIRSNLLEAIKSHPLEAIIWSHPFEAIHLKNIIDSQVFKELHSEIKHFNDGIYQPKPIASSD